jgi:hypothetical protein
VSRPGGGREKPRGARSATRRLPQVDIAPSPRELPGSGSAGAQAAAAPAAAAVLLVGIVLLTLIGLTLRTRYAERRLSSLLWSNRVDLPG